MGKCVVCGKKGLFLRVNAYGRCKECEDKFKREEEERIRIEEEKRKTFEKECLQRQEDDGLFPLFLHSYIVTDIETSGLDHNINSIIEIAAIKVLNGKVVDKYSSLIHRDSILPEKIELMTGITTDMLKSCNMNLNEVIREYSEFVGNYPLIGHNISKFDILFIEKAYEKVFGKSIYNKIVDTLPLSREYIKDSENHKLQTLATHLNLAVCDSHRALSDCQTTLELYKAISSIAEEKEKERQRVFDEVLDPDSDSGKIVQVIKEIFSGEDASYLRFVKKNSYLQFECFYEIFRIKISGRIKNYIVFSKNYEQDILRNINFETSKATSGDAVGTTRIFFGTYENLFLLKEHILSVYKKEMKEVQKMIERSEKSHENAECSRGMFNIYVEYDDAPNYKKWVDEYLNNKNLLKL